jgi:hypothetical protein
MVKIASPLASCGSQDNATTEEALEIGDSEPSKCTEVARDFEMSRRHWSA